MLKKLTVFTVSIILPVASLADSVCVLGSSGTTVYWSCDGEEITQVKGKPLAAATEKLAELTRAGYEIKSNIAVKSELVWTLVKK